MRGIGGHFVFLEEAAYLDPNVIKTVVMPIVLIEGTTLVGISTLGKLASNAFNKMLNSGVYESQTIEYICDMCKKAGITNICKHRIHEVPVWIDTTNNSLSAIFGDDDEDVLLETKGIFSEDSRNCFPEPIVKRMMTTPPYTLLEPQRFVIISIDLCAGTDIADNSISDFNITSMCGPQAVIIRIDSFESISYVTWEPALLAHIKYIRSHTMLENATLVFDIEANGSAEWAHIVKSIRLADSKNIIMNHDFTRKEATKTDNKLKLDAMQITRAMLDANDIRFIDNFTTWTKNPETIKKQVYDQFLKYERLVISNDKVQTHNKFVLSGKGSGKKQKDDICFTIQRCIRSRRVFFENPKYKFLR